MNSVYVEYQNIARGWNTDENAIETFNWVLADALEHRLKVKRIIWEHENGDCDLTEVWEAAE